MGAACLHLNHKDLKEKLLITRAKRAEKILAFYTYNKDFKEKLLITHAKRAEKLFVFYT